MLICTEVLRHARSNKIKYGLCDQSSLKTIKVKKGAFQISHKPTFYLKFINFDSQNDNQHDSQLS